MSDQHPFVCPNDKSLAQYQAQIGELFELLRSLTSRVEANTTFLFGPDRNGGGYIKTHDKAHEEAEVELKETLTELRETTAAMKGQVQVLVDKKGGVVEILKVTMPPVAVGIMAIVMWLVTGRSAP